MIRKELSDWLQVLGLFGVLGGLIFVGLQLALDRNLANVASVDAATSNQQYWTELVNANADVWVRGLAGESLSPTESVRFNELASAREMRFFSDWVRSLRGVSGQPPERWVVEVGMEIHANPGFLKWWKEDREHLSHVRERIEMPNTRWGVLVSQEIERLERGL